MPYLTLDDLTALIPLKFAIEALDDDQDGEIDAFDKVRNRAESLVNGVLENRFPVPLAEPVPQKVKTAAVMVTASLCYKRAGWPDEKNPFFGDAAKELKRLESVSAGDLGLDTNKDREEPLEAGSIVSYESPLGEPNRRLS
jgi:phage gp36-like protein